MAHFARVQDGIVRQVIVVNNEAIEGGAFPASEPLGQALLAESGITGHWLQCSFSGSFRGTYPGPGSLYDADADEFVPPQGEEPPA